MLANSNCSKLEPRIETFETASHFSGVAVHYKKEPPCNLRYHDFLALIIKLSEFMIPEIGIRPEMLLPLIAAPFLHHEDQYYKSIMDLAGAEGFEPTDDGIKTRCLTTWRRPNVLR